MNKRSFASDNNAGVHPKIMQALNDCNVGHVVGYGDDPFTESAIKTFKKHFGETVEPFFVYGGTGANVLAIGSMCRPFESVICANTAHINVDECGAPERFSGAKLVDIPTVDGKLTPKQIKPFLFGFDFEHHSQPKAISISQPTELGTVYSIDELKALRQLADEYNLYLHMDGARISNAAVALDINFSEFTLDCGIDVLSFGGNKNGMMFGEALIFFNPSLAENFKYVRKQAMQLHSKMRFISAQFDAFLQSDLWKENATHSNKMAQVLFEKVSGLPGVEITQKVETNAIFVKIPKEIIPKLQEEYFFYVWNEEWGEVRWMASFDTTHEDIENFVNTLKKYLK
ncbi:MAG: low specificity L-threonine aldolase [Calditrichaeota bacterium]|nr:MAG: low specificity L-threonine aldolase [Calditrichota bacterium]MBL1204107.1 low specificity L-threonine aldolase [Calditrichota bacterium]NOG43938.1 low specificity L-threonine aldolase [Calditrichota bacterium]